MICSALPTSVPSRSLISAPPCVLVELLDSPMLAETHLRPVVLGAVQDYKSGSRCRSSPPSTPSPKAASVCPGHSVTGPCWGHGPQRQLPRGANAPQQFWWLCKHTPGGTDSCLGQWLWSLPEFLDSEPPSSKQVYKEEKPPLARQVPANLGHRWGTG